MFSASREVACMNGCGGPATAVGGDELPALNCGMIEKLARGEELIAAADLMTPEACTPLAKAVLSDPMLSGYGSANKDDQHESKAAAEIRRGGLTCYEACNSQLRETYFALARQIDEHFRSLFSPNLSPMDLFVDQVRSSWRPGVVSEMWHGQPMAGLVTRAFAPGSQALLHNDVLWVDQDGDVEAPLVSQLAVNIYLAMPPRGGELELWGWMPSRPLHKALQMPGNYGLDRNAAGEPFLRVRPRPGQALIFNPTMIHAVTESLGGWRLTLSCFLGYRGPGRPLTRWA